MTNKSIRDYINLIENAQREGVAEAAPSTELQDKMRQVRPKGKGITRTELQNAMRRKGKKQWHCPECATYDDNVHGKFCSKYKPKEQGVAEGYDEWNARELEKSRTRHPDGTGSTPSKTLAKLMRIPGFSKVSPAEQQRVAKAVDRYIARDMSFDQALVLAQKQGVAEEQVEESTPDAMAKIDDLFRK